jgi:hypothetical protein
LNDGGGSAPAPQGASSLPQGQVQRARLTLSLESLDES